MDASAMDCPDEDELDAYVRGETSPARRRAIEAHLSDCADCRCVVATAARVATVSPSAHDPNADVELPAPSERYTWLEPLGQGAMGIVYRAYDRFLDRDVAIKVLRDDGTPLAASARRRLLGESRALARVTHPNVVTVHDVGVDDGELFIAMELVRGASLRRWLEVQTRSWPQILEVFDAALAGLAAIHDAGLVHRDFKPDNVLVGDDGSVKVTDFGLVRGSAGPSLATTPNADVLGHSLTRDGDLVGTPAYLAPELFGTGTATASSDQFAACVALHEALHGRRPFEATTLAALAERVTRGELASMPRSAVPRRIGTVIRRGLAVDPARRYPSIRALAAALREARARRRSRGAIVASVAAVLAIGAGVASVSAPVDPCVAEASPFSGPRRQLVEDALARRGPTGKEAAPVFAAELDRWSQGWADTRQVACEATRVEHSHDETWLAAAQACSDAQLVELSAVVHAAERVENAWKAVDLARELPSPRRCEDPEPARARTQDDLALDELRASVKAATYIGDLSTVEAHLDALVGSADAATDLRLRAGALAVAGRAAMEVGRRDDAAQILERATEAAVAAHAPATAAAALLDRVQLEGVWRGHPQQARAFAELARAHVAVAGDPRLEAQLEFTLGNIARSRDEIPDAMAHCERAMQLLDPNTTPAATLAAVRMCVADMHVQLGELDRAEAIYRALADEIANTFSDEHPMLGGIMNGLGAVALERGDAPAAEQHWQEALRLTRATRGERDPRIVGILANVSSALERQGQVGEGRRLLHDAIDLGRELHGPRHAIVSALLSNLAASYLENDEPQAARPWLEQASAALPDDETYLLSRASIAGNLGLSYLPDDPQEARPHLQRAIDLATEAVGADHEEVAFHLVELAECELLAERPRLALPLLRRAEAIYDAGGETAASRRARVAFRQSQAVFFAEDGEDPRGEARRLAARARALDREQPAPVAHPELEAWIAFLGE
jgi:tetratricopeptide (TPR) repeat protein/tRNA A-37 threonylcarbamoyl transferase component Bud32